MTNFLEVKRGKGIPLPSVTPHQRRVTELLRMQRQDQIAAAGEAFAAVQAQDGRRATELSKSEYKKLKANLRRALLGVPPR